LDNFTLINTVPSKYCSNLVDPMVALMQAGLEKRGHILDKLVFVSYDSIPVKPFGDIYEELVENRAGESDFCLAPVSQWTHEKAGFVVKHHQWFVLSRVHAAAAVEQDVQAKSIVKGRPMLQRFKTCADEFWGFTAVFGRVTGGATGTANITGLNQGVVHLTGEASKNNQGRCDTFIDVPVFHWPMTLIDNWNEFAGQSFAEISKVLHQIPNETGSLSQTQGRRLRDQDHTGRTSLLSSAVAEAGHRGPRRISLLSQESLQALRRSPFLFARKVSPAYTKVANNSAENMTLAAYDAPDAADALAWALDAFLLSPQPVPEA